MIPDSHGPRLRSWPFLLLKHTNRFSFNRFRINNPVLLPTQKILTGFMGYAILTIVVKLIIVSFKFKKGGSDENFSFKK
jgi:hypothetical protein